MICSKRSDDLAGKKKEKKKKTFKEKICKKMFQKMLRKIDERIIAIAISLCSQFFCDRILLSLRPARSEQIYRAKL